MNCFNFITLDLATISLKFKQRYFNLFVECFDSQRLMTR